MSRRKEGKIERSKRQALNHTGPEMKRAELPRTWKETCKKHAKQLKLLWSANVECLTARVAQAALTSLHPAPAPVVATCSPSRKKLVFKTELVPLQVTRRTQDRTEPLLAWPAATTDSVCSPMQVPQSGTQSPAEPACTVRLNSREAARTYLKDCTSPKAQAAETTAEATAGTAAKSKCSQRIEPYCRERQRKQKGQQTPTSSPRDRKKEAAEVHVQHVGLQRINRHEGAKAPKALNMFRSLS